MDPSGRMRLLGTAAYEPAEGPSQPLSADLSGAIVASIAATPGWVSRSRLAARVWPERSESTARTNLRWHLHQVRKRPWGLHVESNGEHVRWAARCDVLEFEQALVAGDRAAAVAAYRGPLLAGDPGDVPASLAHWFDVRRADLHARWREQLLAGGDEVAAELLFEALLRALQHEPLEPQLVERMLDVAQGAGRVDEGRRAYEAYRRRLADEVDARPSSALRLRAALRLAPTLPSQVDLPADEATLELSAAGRYLLAVWRTASGEAPLEQADRQAVWRLVRASGGVRVALEAMAEAAATLSLREAAAGWEARPVVPGASGHRGARDGDDPWRRLDDAMEMVWRALPDDDQAHLARLATLDAPVRFELAGSLVSLDTRRWQRWLRAQLIVPDGDAGVRVLAPLRAWLASVTPADVWEHHEAVLSTTLLERFSAAVMQPGADLAALATDLEVVEAAWQAALRRGALPLLDGTLAAWDRWHRLHGDFEVGRERFAAVAALAAADATTLETYARALVFGAHMLFRLGRAREAERLLAQAEGGPLRPVDAAMAAQVRGAIAYEAGDVEGAEQGFGRRLAIARELSDVRSEAEALNNLALVDRLAQRSDDAAERLWQASALLRSIGDERGAGSAQLNLALVEATRGAYRAYADASRVALALFEGLPRVADRALARANLADALCIVGPVDEARRQAQTAVAEARQADVMQYVVIARTALGRAHYACGERDQAATTLGLAEQEARIAASPERLQLIHAHRAWLAFTAGHLDDAERWACAALQHAERSGAPVARLEALRARIAVHGGAFELGRTALERARAAAADAEDRAVPAALLEVEAELALWAGEPDVAADAAMRALPIVDRSGRLSERVWFRLLLAEWHLERGELDDAFAMHAGAFELADGARSLPQVRAADLTEARLLAAVGRLESAQRLARRVARSRHAGAVHRRAARRLLSTWSATGMGS